VYPFDKDNPLRKISVWLLLKPLLWTGISANTVSVIGFLFGLTACYFFAKGWEYVGLCLCGISASFDYCDGSIARYRHESSFKGQFLDTSLDYFYLMLIVGSISFFHNILSFGYISLMAITLGNWIQYNGNVNIKLPFPLTIQFILFISILFAHAELGITAIMFIQSIRTALLYERSLCSFTSKT
jgi:phosphatidylglycerophosphate synthase